MPQGPYDLTATGPGTLAGRYLRRFWQPIAILASLDAGRAKPVRLMGENLTLYRGTSGTPYLVASRCLHRGVQLSVGTVEGEHLRCRYHGWKYAGNGQCVEQPAELDKQFCAKVRLRNFPTRVYKGLVFAYLGEAEPPPFPIYPELEGDGIVEAIVYRRNCNFFNSIDNLFDESHVAFTHPLAFSRIPEIPRITYKKNESDAFLYSERPGKGVRVRQFLMPNVLRLKVPSSEDPEVYWVDYVNWRLPIDDGAHDTFGVIYVNVTGAARERYLARSARLASLPVPPMDDLADAILRGDKTLEEVEQQLGEVDAYYKVYIEDHVTQIGQGVIADRDAEWLGIADVGVRVLRDLWYEHLDRLAKGNPIEITGTVPDIETASGDIADFATS
jgi:5,5'-dehydrodivanillate O-demethylase oxygenase subunit